MHLSPLTVNRTAVAPPVAALPAGALGCEHGNGLHRRRVCRAAITELPNAVRTPAPARATGFHSAAVGIFDAAVNHVRTERQLRVARGELVEVTKLSLIEVSRSVVIGSIDSTLSRDGNVCAQRASPGECRADKQEPAGRRLTSALCGLGGFGGGTLVANATAPLAASQRRTVTRITASFQEGFG